MADLISRAAAIDELKRTEALSRAFGYHAVIDAIEALPSAQPEQRWISCSPETMPETEERVLVTCEHLNCYGKHYRYICKAFHVDRYAMESTGNWDEGCDEYREEDDKFYVLEGWYEVIHNWGDYGAVKIEDKVVAWMPLPEPYLEGR